MLIFLSSTSMRPELAENIIPVIIEWITLFRFDGECRGEAAVSCHIPFG
jgi:hypothetical protein